MHFQSLNLNMLSSSKSLKFQFEIDIHEARILIPFRCLMQILLKRGQQKIATKKKIKLLGGEQQHLFNETLCLKTGLPFDGKNIGSKDATLSLILMTEMGNKIGGVLSINLAKFISQKLMEGRELKGTHEGKFSHRFQRSPDSEAFLTYTLTAKFLYQSHDDSSMGSSVSMTSNNSMFAASRNNLMDITFRHGQANDPALDTGFNTSISMEPVPSTPPLPAQGSASKSQTFRRETKENPLQHSRVNKQKHEENERLVKRIAELQRHANEQLNKHNQLIRKYDQDRLNIVTSFQKANEELIQANSERQQLRTRVQGFESEVERLGQADSKIKALEAQLQEKCSREKQYLDISRSFEDKLREMEHATYRCNSQTTKKEQEIASLRELLGRSNAQLAKTNGELAKTNGELAKTSGELARLHSQQQPLREQLAGKDKQLSDWQQQLKGLRELKQRNSRQAYQLELRLKEIHGKYQAELRRSAQLEKKLTEQAKGRAAESTLRKELEEVARRAATDRQKFREEMESNMQRKLAQLESAFEGVNQSKALQIQAEIKRAKAAQENALRALKQRMEGEAQAQVATVRQEEQKKYIERERIIKAEMEKIFNARTKFMQQAQQLDKENKKLRAGLADAQQSSKTEQTRLESSRRRAIQEASKLQEQCYTLALEKSSLIDRSSDLQKQLASLTQRSQSLVQVLQQKQQESHQLSESLRRHRAGHSDRIDGLLRQLGQLKEQSSLQLQALKGKLQERDSKVAGLESLVEGMQRERASGKRSEQELAELKAANQKRACDVFMAKEEAIRFEEDLINYKQESTRKMQQLTSQNKSMSRQNEQLERRYRELESALKAMNERSRTTQERLQSLQQDRQHLKQSMEKTILRERESHRDQLEQSQYRVQQCQILEDKCKELEGALGEAEGSLVDKDSIISQCWESITRMQERLAHEVALKTEEQRRLAALECEFEKDRAQLEQRVVQKDRHLALYKSEFEMTLGEQRTLFTELEEQNNKLQDQNRSIKAALEQQGGAGDTQKLKRLGGLAIAECELMDGVRTMIEFTSNLIRESKADKDRPWLYQLEREQALDKLKEISQEIGRKDLKAVISAYYNKDKQFEEALKQRMFSSGISCAQSVGDRDELARRLQEREKTSVRRQEKLRKLEKEVKKLEEENLRLNVKMMKELSQLKRRHDSRYKC